MPAVLEPIAVPEIEERSPSFATELVGPIQVHTVAFVKVNILWTGLYMFMFFDESVVCARMDHSIC